MFTLNDLPVELFGVALLILIPFGIYEYIKSEKQNPGNPFNKMIFFGIPAIVMVFFNKITDKLNVSANIEKIMSIVTIISCVLFFIASAIAWTLSYKKGYIDKEELNRRKPMLKSLGIFIAILSIILTLLIVVMKLDEHNLLP
jgi:hypothetical protein